MKRKAGRPKGALSKKGYWIDKILSGVKTFQVNTINDAYNFCQSCRRRGVSASWTKKTGEFIVTIK
jgi:hypothetical protein